MKVQHKNSLEIFDLSEPKYTKFSEYGYLVNTNEKVFFITFHYDELFSDDVTDDFIIL